MWHQLCDNENLGKHMKIQGYNFGKRTFSNKSAVPDLDSARYKFGKLTPIIRSCLPQI